MRPVAGAWRQLAKGMYVQDKNGEAWRIDDEKDGHFGMMNRDGRQVIVPPQLAAAPVTILVPDDVEMLAALSEKLGAELIGEYDHATGTYRCPTPPYDSSWWKDHLVRFHGVWSDERFEEIHASTPAIVQHDHV